MDIFGAQRPGLVARMQLPGGSMGLVSMDGLSSSGAAVITSFNVGLGVNNQYSPALDRAVYVYGFGDSIGTITVSGLTFKDSCNSGSDGLGEVLRFYASRRAISDVKISVTIRGGTTVEGFLDKADIGADDPELQLGRFTLSASTLPAMMGF